MDTLADILSILLGLVWAIYYYHMHYKTTDKKIRESDANPYNTIKSDRWYKEHKNESIGI
jgi:hypothetical protein